jgi:O-antigen/teichoic acid export membrane protein
LSALHKNLATRVITTAGVRGAAAFLSLLLTIVIVRVTSPERLGSFAAALVTVQLITIVSAAGVDSIYLRMLIRISAKGQTRLARPLRRETHRLLATTSFGGLLAALLLAGGLALLRPDLQQTALDMAVLSPMTVFLNMSRMSSMTLRSAGRDGLAQMVDQTLPAPVALVLIVLLHLLGVDVSGPLPLLYVGGAACSYLLALVLVRDPELRRLTPRLTRGRWRVLRVAIPAQAANIANLIADWAATASLTLFAPISAVAVYRVISQVGLVYQLISTGFEVPFSSAIAMARLEGRLDHVRQLVRTTQIGAFLLGLPLSLLLALFPGLFLSIFHLRSAAAETALLIGIVSFQLRLAGGAAAGALNVIDAVALLLRASVLALVLALLLSFTLTPLLGLIGAVLAAGLTLVARAGLGWLYLRRVVRADHALAVARA